MTTDTTDKTATAPKTTARKTTTRTRKTTTAKTTTAKSSSASKLATSVRRAKTTQKTEAEKPVEKLEETAAPVETPEQDEQIKPMPSSRVWPD